MPTNENREIRVHGRRRAFEVGRFVLAIMVQAEALAEADQASASPDTSAPNNTTEKTEQSSQKPLSQTIEGTVFSRSDPELPPSTPASPPNDGEAA